MKIALVELESASPISFSKYYEPNRLEGESHLDHEKRTWRNKLHVNQDGNVVVPPLMIKNTLANAAKYMGRDVPHNIQLAGKATHTKHFEAGILCMEPMALSNEKGLITPDQVQDLWLMVPSDGKRGGTTRVARCFPTIPEWTGTATIHVLDDKITNDAFEFFLEKAGQFIGFGALRVRNNGYHGRFTINNIVWSCDMIG